ncbi:hypothetical protein B0H17DRAFT_719221 [Mycena rosella]|uniref:Uncharacterized protein n=1 Tax=Mycena rosella TaxID=1033263 RepID=A0AAD7B6D3_MYCRO|nr:hypothetical protein B0H17DRAFT_719221 [Mycena rosella]
MVNLCCIAFLFHLLPRPPATLIRCFPLEPMRRGLLSRVSIHISLDLLPPVRAAAIISISISSSLSVISHIMNHSSLPPHPNLYTPTWLVAASIIQGLAAHNSQPLLQLCGVPSPASLPSPRHHHLPARPTPSLRTSITSP